jgi:hypothetical protein
MKPVLFPALLLVALTVSFTTQSFAQHPEDRNGSGVNVPGTLELVEKPPAATPVEALRVAVHELHGAHQFSALPDPDGKFVLANVRPGRYFLVLSFPGRIRVFASGPISLMPDDFTVTAGENVPLRIVVSLKSSVLSVDAVGVPDNNRHIVALLSPADPYLTLRESSVINAVSGRHTQFAFTPPGTYRLFIVDSEFQKALAFSAAVRNALKDKATLVEVPDHGEMKITASYLTPDIVKQAIAQAGPGKVSVVLLPEEPAQDQVIRSQGRLDIQQTYQADLDDGVISRMGEPLGPPYDLWYEAVNPQLRYLVPVNGALLAIGSSGCASVELSNPRIDMSKLRKGTVLCLQTNEGRYSEITIEDLYAPNPNQPDVLTQAIEYKTWDR